MVIEKAMRLAIGSENYKLIYNRVMSFSTVDVRRHWGLHEVYTIQT